jgi:hypothetical protein
VTRDEESHDGSVRAEWVRSLLLPLVVLVVAVAVVSGLVLGGVVRGERTYEDRSGTSTTQPTVLIEPRIRRGWCV